MPEDPWSPRLIVTDGATCGTHSNIGDRPKNEDSSYCWSRTETGNMAVSTWLIAVADGLGGHPRGEEASAAAIAALDDFNPSNSTSPLSDEELTDIFRSAFNRVELLSSHSCQGDTESGMHLSAQPATTLTVATRTADSDIKVANLGDSRAYVIAPDGDLIFASAPHQSALGYLTKCIGDQPFTVPDIIAVQLAESLEGTVVVCVTDGVWGPLTRHGDDLTFAERIHGIREEVGHDGRRLAKRLARDAVVEHGRGADNATVSAVIL